MKTGELKLTAAYELNEDGTKTALPFTTIDEAMNDLEKKTEMKTNEKYMLGALLRWLEAEMMTATKSEKRAFWSGWAFFFFSIGAVVAKFVWIPFFFGK